MTYAVYICPKCNMPWTGKRDSSDLCLICKTPGAREQLDEILTKGDNNE